MAAVLEALQEACRGQPVAVMRALLKLCATICAMSDRLRWMGWCVQRLRAVDPDATARTCLFGVVVVSGHVGAARQLVACGVDLHVRCESVVAYGSHGKMVANKQSSCGLLHRAATLPPKLSAARPALVALLLEAGVDPRATAAYAEAGGARGHFFQRLPAAAHALLAHHPALAAQLLAGYPAAICRHRPRLRELMADCLTALLGARKAAAAQDAEGLQLAMDVANGALSTACADHDVTADAAHALELRHCMEAIDAVMMPTPDEPEPGTPPDTGKLEAQLRAGLNARAEALLARQAARQNLPAEADGPELLRVLLTVAVQSCTALLRQLGADDGAGGITAASTASAPADAAADDEALAEAVCGMLPLLGGMTTLLESHGPLSAFVLRGRLDVLTQWLDLGGPVVLEDLVHAYVFTLPCAGVEGLTQGVRDQMRQQLLTLVTTPQRLCCLTHVALQVGDAAPLQALWRAARRRNVKAWHHVGATFDGLLAMAAERGNAAVSALLGAVHDAGARARWLRHTTATGDTPLHLAARRADLALTTVLGAVTQDDACLRAVNVSGATPLQEALAFGHGAHAGRILARLAPADLAQLDAAALAQLPGDARQALRAALGRSPTMAAAFDRWNGTAGAAPTTPTAAGAPNVVTLPPAPTEPNTPPTSRPVAAKTAIRPGTPAPAPQGARLPSDAANVPAAARDVVAAIYAGPNADARRRLAAAYLAQAAQLSPSAANDGAWAVLQALHVASGGREVGRHFAAHRPDVPFAALRRRCLSYRHYASSRFGAGDGLALLRARERALTLLAEAPRQPWGAFAVHLRDANLSGEGVLYDPATQDVELYRDSPLVRVVLRQDEAGDADVVALYPVAGTASAHRHEGKLRAVAW